ncbi:MAG: NADH:ubiquinone reductase (Na(+)-transporting) subunit D [Xanthomonadales bacterium]|jgi:Na+-transporting NADH:ubiquinone oxidoreductase subunit D|nr:NADH:ubiquinone reductase (Na(+)-transporting) subunit D [Xanthomonadales bacterium]
MALNQTLTDPLINKNPITLHVLGICSALAITNSLTSSLIMSVSLTIVLIISNVAISAVRHHLPSSVRLIVQITIIASSVTVIDQFLKAYMPDAARTLSVYVALIVTNCIVLGRAEACAMSNGIKVSTLDALGNGFGYSLVLITVAFIRELFGAGSLMGRQIFRLAHEGGWFQENNLFLLAPSAFFIIGFLIWAIRAWKPEQNEEPDFKPIPLPNREKRA